MTWHCRSCLKDLVLSLLGDQLSSEAANDRCGACRGRTWWSRAHDLF